MKLIPTKVLAILAVLAAAVYSQGALSQTNSDIQSILQSKERIDKLGFEKALLESEWPKQDAQFAADLSKYNVSVNSSNLFDDCTDSPWSLNCLGSNNPDPNLGNTPNMQLKDDAVQILATEVLYQTLTFFKVKHVFGKLKSKPNTYGFKVIDPVEGQPYQDLDSDAVVAAIRQFRKYVIGLICNDPSPARVLGMMNRYDVGTRFRWDMAWALLGNDLPDAPNKFMAFGAKWRKFSLAIDGIENGSLIRVLSPGGAGGGGGDWSNGITPPVAGTAPHASLAKVGFIAREVVGIMRLAGDVISAILELVCISDLNVNQTKEAQKKDVIYKLLEVKRKAYDRYGPLRPILEQIGQKASQAAGTPISVFP